MGFLFKKKEVPDELPSLAVEGIAQRKGVGSMANGDVSKYNSISERPVEPRFADLDLKDEVQVKIKSLPPIDDDQGYFKELIKNVIEGTHNFDKLDSWYNNKFLKEDMIFHMREYWEKQQPELLLKNISGELKIKLLEKTNKLHMMEKEWQNIYFNLLSKEEQIRKEEKELKESLSEFMDLIKKSKNRGKGK